MRPNDAMSARFFEMSSSLAARLVGVICLAQAACVADVCGQRCGVAGECPSGFMCEGERNVCVPEDDPGACSVLAAAETPGLVTGAAGASSGGASSAEPSSGGASSDVGNDGSSSGDGEGDGAPDDDTPADVELPVPPLAIGIDAPREVCTSDEVLLELTAHGGAPVAPYRWRLIDAPASFNPREAEGEHVALRGAPPEPGEVVLRVELGDGTTTITESFTLLVRERPRIVTDRLPGLCPGERVETALRLAGGDPSSHELVTRLDPALGLRVEGTTLLGRFSPLGAGDALGAPARDLATADEAASPGTTLELTVRDRYCDGDPREIPIEVLAAGSESCPRILVAASPERAALPPPCLGSDYEQRLLVQQANGAGPHTWRELHGAPGLRFDPAAQLVRGTPLGAGIITLAVTDPGGRTVEVDLPVAPRERCWLAYLAERDDSRRLHLFDARLPQRAAARRAYPQADLGDDGSRAPADVLDFAFSPGGRFVSYRLAPERGPSALRLLDLRSWRERELEFEGSVEKYAWSGADDSAAALAVAFDGGEGRLGGVALSLAASEPATRERREPSLPTPELRYFEPRAARVRSSLFWFDDDHVAFLTPDPVFDAGGLFQAARFDEESVAVLEPRERIEFFDGSRFMPGARGVFAITSEGSPFFVAASGAAEVPHAADVIISPSGAFTARALGGMLQLFRASDPSATPNARPWAQAAGCTSLLAWASGRERIACAAASGAEQSIVFFDLPDPERPSIVPLLRVQGDYRFQRGQHLGNPRLFSPDATRFAFTTGDDLYMVLLDDGTPRIVLAQPIATLASGPAQLSFSPRGAYLSAHAGDSLTLWNLQAERPAPGRVPALLPEPAACTENFLAPDAAWCGGQPSAAITRWSADEDSIAYLDDAGALHVVDLPHDFPRNAHRVPVDDSCADGCLVPGAYEFQR